MGTRLEPYEPLRPVGEMVDTDTLMRTLDDLRRIIDQFVRLEILDGVLIQDQTITTGSTNFITHTLGRAYRGWIVTNLDTACTIHLDETSTAARSLFLPLVASATCEADIWVF